MFVYTCVLGNIFHAAPFHLPLELYVIGIPCGSNTNYLSYNLLSTKVYLQEMKCLRLQGAQLIDTVKMKMECHRAV